MHLYLNAAPFSDVVVTLVVIVEVASFWNVGACDFAKKTVCIF